jgi:transcriptional regulator with XRE-family HTH domain
MDRLARAGILCVPPPETIAHIVKLNRGMLGCKQEALASMAGVSLSTVERIERGEKVSPESLDRVACVLGYKVGDFTAPRVPLTVEQMASRFADAGAPFLDNEPVPVRHLRTQPQIAALARTQLYLLDGARLGEGYDDEMAALRELLDFVVFILQSDDDRSSPIIRSEPVSRRKLYTMTLDLIADIERKANAVALGGTYRAPTNSPLLPEAEVAVIGFFPRKTDPAAAQRKFLLAPKEIDLADALQRYCTAVD